MCVAGPVYRRDRIDPLHVGVPHQLDVWPVRTGGRPLGERDLTDLLEAIISGLLPDSEWWTQRHPKGAIPYNRASRELHCRSAAGVDVEVLECGLATPSLLASCGLPRDSSGLGLGMGLDRMAMLIKGIDDIRLLRAEHPRVREQMYDLSPYEPVDWPGRVVALELHRRRPVDEKEIGDDVRRTLGPDQSVVQSICVLPVERLQSAGGRPPGDPDSVVARIAIELRDVNGPLDERQAELIVHRLRQSLDSPLH